MLNSKQTKKLNKKNPHLITKELNMTADLQTQCLNTTDNTSVQLTVQLAKWTSEATKRQMHRREIMFTTTLNLPPYYSQFPCLF